ncbi:DUF6020 family protein [Bifidobacterium platyrrhinorum]|uniref:DUF6020 family protein n=1 Tax=Bifidobacterium platyrrhinorum TaxID=2661628 RepID=UPI00298CD694|nr:DUF6020 family protein [Bifidobacterium platyrrhinorum]
MRIWNRAASRTGWLAAAAAWLEDRRPSTFRDALRARFPMYFGILLLCWLPWIVLTWPGAMRDDTLAQYLQAAGLHRYYTQHPLFDTLIFGLFWKLGAALGSPLIGQGIYTLVQAAALAAGCALLLCAIRRYGAPLWLVNTGLIYLATSYVVVGAVPTMGKDSLHTVFFLPLAVLAVETCLTRGRVLRRTPVAVAFTLLAFAAIASKRTALLIVLCAGVGILCVCSKRRDRIRAAVCLAAAILLAQGVFAPIATAVTRANVSPGREVWGLVTQPVAQVAHDKPDAITPAQRKALNAVMDLDEAAAGINLRRTDETFRTLREPHVDADGNVTRPGPTAAQKLAALGAWARIGVEHPLEYAKAYAGPIRGWWDPGVTFAYPTDSDYLMEPGYLRQWSTFLPAEAVPQRPGATVDEARLEAVTRDLEPLMGTSDKPQWQRDVLHAVRSWVRTDTAGMPGTAAAPHERPAGNPLSAMALYVTWIPLATGIALIVQAVRHRNGRKLAAFGLLFFTVLSLYASPEALFWYPIPVFLSLPLFTALPFVRKGA